MYSFSVCQRTIYSDTLLTSLGAHPDPVAVATVCLYLGNPAYLLVRWSSALYVLMRSPPGSCTSVLFILILIWVTRQSLTLEILGPPTHFISRLNKVRDTLVIGVPSKAGK